MHRGHVQSPLLASANPRRADADCLGEFAGVPASGNKVAVGSFHVHRVECGKVAETWNAGDALSLFQQMGALDRRPTGSRSYASSAVSSSDLQEPRAPTERFRAALFSQLDPDSRGIAWPIRAP